MMIVFALMFLILFVFFAIEDVSRGKNTENKMEDMPMKKMFEKIDVKVNAAKSLLLNVCNIGASNISNFTVGATSSDYR